MIGRRLGENLTCLCFFLFLNHITSSVANDASSNIHASGCTGQQLQLSCPQYHRIAIKRVFYGLKRGWDCRPDTSGYRGRNDRGNRDFSVNVSPNDCCRSSHIDCHMDDDSMYPTLNTKCSGYQSCELEIQKIHTKEPCRHKAYTDYMTIVYDCISVGDIATFCSDDVKRGKSLYLANKEYPATIRPQPEGGDCQCIIRTSHPQGIGIHAIDVLLAWSDLGPMECRRNLKIQDPMTYHRDVQCANRGYYGFKSMYSRPVSNVTITLSSLPGDGMAFVWLQAKPNDADGSIEIFCGQSLQELLSWLRHQSESRHRESNKKEEQADKSDEKNKTGKIDNDDEKSSNGTEATITSGSQALNPDLASIIGGIVAAGFAMIAMVIIAMSFHCRRIRKEGAQSKPLELYPAVNSEPLDLASYCRYDFDDDHLCSINRSLLKMAALADEGKAGNSFRPNGFTTMAHAEECQLHRDLTPSPPLPPGISTPPPSVQNQPLLAGRSYREVHYPGDMSLRFVKPLVSSSSNNNTNNATVMSVDRQLNEHCHPQGHTTLPSNRKAVLISCGPKSPLGKRSKSVTFSQPVAMVTPLNSESEESMEKPQVNMDPEDPSYDNLNKLDIPDYPIIPGKPELVSIPRWDKEYNQDNTVRTMSTFQNSPSPLSETKVFITPPCDLSLTSDPDNLFSDQTSFWSPTRQTGKPLILPKPQKAELYETGV